LIYDKRITLIKEVSKKYDPIAKETKLVTEDYGVFPCQISPITRQREMATFGQINVASTVVRLQGQIPNDVKYAENIDGKYEIVDLRNYFQDAIIYLNEVTEW